MPLVTSGVENGNLRELALARMRDMGLRCRDVRTREVGIKDIHDKVRPDEVELIRRDYAANSGWETFLAYEDPKQGACRRARRRPGGCRPYFARRQGSAVRRGTRCCAFSASIAVMRAP